MSRGQNDIRFRLLLFLNLNEKATLIGRIKKKDNTFGAKPFEFTHKKSLVLFFFFSFFKAESTLCFLYHFVRSKGRLEKCTQKGQIA